MRKKTRALRVIPDASCLARSIPAAEPLHELRLADVWEAIGPEILDHAASASAADWRSLRRHLDRVFGQLPLVEWRPRHLLAWYSALKTEAVPPLSEARIKTLEGLTSALIERARTAGLFPLDAPNPVGQVPRRLRPRRTAVDPGRGARELLTAEQAAALIWAPCLPLWRRWAWTGALCLGVRLGELAGLEWGDVDLTAPGRSGIRIERQRHAKSGALRPTKGRRVVLVPLADPLLEGLPKIHREIWRRLGRPPQPTDPVFPALVRASPGMPIEVRRLSATSALRWWHDDLETLGIAHPGRPRRLHATRHWFISTLHSLGAPAASVRALTHFDHRTSRQDAHQAYVHVTYADLCKAIALIDLSAHRPAAEQLKGPAAAQLELELDC